MNKFERYLYNQKTQNELKQLIERMNHESKSSAKGTQEREKTPSQSGETRIKKFDDIEEVELCFGQMRELF